MSLSQRQGVFIVFGIQVAGLVIAILAQLGLGRIPSFLTIGGFLVYATATAAYWRSWELARPIMVILVTLVMGFSTSLTDGFNVAILIPVAVATVAARPSWVIGSGILTYAIVMARGGQASYGDPQRLVFYITIVASLFVARIVADTAQRKAEQNARAAEDERGRTAEQARALAEANARQEDQLAQQQRLLDLVATLETPAVQIADGVLFVPIVGHLDSRRAQKLTARLLEDTHDRRARQVIMDVSGVGVVDTGVAQSILKTAQALRLLGCEVVLSGISADVATTLVQLGVELGGLATVRDPQEALGRYVRFSA